MSSDRDGRSNELPQRRMIDLRALDVVGDVDEHRALAAILSDPYRLLELVEDARVVHDGDGVLRHRAHHVDDRRLLEAVLPYAEGGAEAEGCDLAREVEDRDRVVKRGCNARDQVRRPWTRRSQSAAKATNTRISVSSEARPAFVRRRAERDLRRFGDA